MGEASSAPGQIISLPKGGGALQGLGEKFAPDLFTGTGNFTVPIIIPAGRNGLQPQLNLVYSSGAGHGPFGLGWSVGIPGVSRKTSKGVPVYDDARDVFILSGAEDLVPVSGAPPGATRYRPRTEGLFARIVHHRTPGDNYWEVRSRDGLTSLYGTPGTAGSDPAVIADPGVPQQARVFTWQLTQSTDPFGNRIAYSYAHDAVRTDGPHHWDQAYLSEVRYVDYGDPGNPQFLVSVRFVYDDRPDRFSNYRGGFEIRTVKRCRRIEVHTNPGADILARTYHLTYLDERGLSADNLPLNGVSLLSQIVVEGHDGPASETLPPLECGYTRFEPQRRTFIPLTGPEMPVFSLARPDHELVDVTGNGLPDFLETNGAMRYWRNLGDGRFDVPREINAAPAGVRLSDKGVQLLDANGDSRPDLLVTTDTIAGYYPMQFGGLWDRKSFQRYRRAPSFDLKDSEVRLVDLDGDGVTDAIRSGSRLECFFNDAADGWNGTRWLERRSLDTFPDVNFSDPRVKWADMTGDGLQDIVLVHDGLVEYWPSLGWGNWGNRLLMRGSPRLPAGYDPKRVLLGDVDGDGLADLVYVEDTRVTLWINQCGTAWSRPIEIKGTPPLTDRDAVRLSDVLGTGVHGVLWSADATESGVARIFFLDFTGATKPYLLCEIDNYMGAMTRVGYAPSTRFYVEDARHIDTRWKTPLPFPVQVVACVEAIDAISGGKLTTEYAYHHGYWDGAEREFRGFGRVDQRDTETFVDYHAPGLHPHGTSFTPVPVQFFSPPTETRTWFHQGPIGDEAGGWDDAELAGEYWPDDPSAFSRPQAVTDFLNGLPRRGKRDAFRSMRGQVRRTELYAMDGAANESRPYTVTERLLGVREETQPAPTSVDGPRIFFPYLLAERTTQWERGTEPQTRLTFTDDYDAYGQPRAQTSIAVPRGRDYRVAAASGTPYLAAYTQTAYAQRDDAQRYIVDRTASRTTFEISNDGSPPAGALHDLILTGATARRLFEQTVSFYDGDAFTGLSFGELGNHGALVRTERLVLNDAVVQAAYADGNTVALPPYLAAGGPPPWTDEYGPEFRRLLAAQPTDPTRPGLAITAAGYGFAAGGGQAPLVRGYFAAVDRRSYDVQGGAGGGRGLVTVKRSPLGGDTRIAYDSYQLLPAEVHDPVDLVTAADYDYRVLQPRISTNPNGNQTAYTFSPLGLPATTAVMGKAGEPAGDTPNAPGTRWVHDLAAYDAGGTPVSVRTIRRVHHVNDADVPPPDRDATVEWVEYYDGHGRLLQSRIQAEDVLFGDPPFDHAGLPADLSGLVGDAIGQARAAADPPAVVVNGRRTFDNKGRIVEQYEPAFSTGWAYGAPGQGGQKVTLYYDALGRTVRIVNPDGSEHRTVYGVPTSLGNPDQITPTPWETYTYDANDNAGRTHPVAALTYQSHWNTPLSIEVDALGRTTRAAQRIASGGAYVTHTAYDIAGNILAITDPLGRAVIAQVFDFTNRLLRTDHPDAGLRRSAFDAAGNLLECRDGRGALTLRAYDRLNRQIRMWARDDAAGASTLREYLDYGDGGDPAQAPAARAAAKAANLLGKPERLYDEAGQLTVGAYDLKGNVTEVGRRVLSDAQILSVFDHADAQGWKISAYRVDWQPPNAIPFAQHAEALLDAIVYQTSTRYDALSRIALLTYPQTVDGHRPVLRPRYNAAGTMARVELDGSVFVERIAYSARGQRTLIAYGNGVMIRYAYDPLTFRLARLRVERFTQPGPLRYHPAGQPLSDCAYTHDLVGNIWSLRDAAPGSGVLNNPDALQAGDPQLAQQLAAGDTLLRRFEYDPLYRLTAATGRECADIPSPRPWADASRCGAGLGTHGSPNQGNAPALTTTYREAYAYDPADNLVSLSHTAKNAAWVRAFGVGGQTPAQWSQAWPAHLDAAQPWASAPGNRLTHVGDDDPGTPQTHWFDANGNLVQELATRALEWDAGNRLRASRTQVPGTEPTVYAQYCYDGHGGRVKTVIRTQGGAIETTVAIEEIFEHHRSNSVAGIVENNSLHVMDARTRIARVRVGAPFSDDGAPAVQYHLADFLGNSVIVVDDTGGWVNREEYTPYGETAFGSFARKRFRYTGRERDAATGLAHHGARYYAPWLGRWTACDPQGLKDGLNLYAYVSGNPLLFVDPLGTEGQPPESQERRAVGPIRHVPHGHVHLIVVGTNPPEGVEFHLKDPRAITKRVDTVLNKHTTDSLSNRLGPGDRVVVLYPESLDPKLARDLERYGKDYGSAYQTIKVPANALRKTLRMFSNVMTLYFFGHGGDRPLFVFNGNHDTANERFPRPSRANLGEHFFAKHAMAFFYTCHSWDYAQQVTEEFKIEAWGVEGTTYFGEETISAGRRNPQEAPGTATWWQYYPDPGNPQGWNMTSVPGFKFLQPMAPEKTPRH